MSAYASVEAEPVHLFSMVKTKPNFDIPSTRGWSSEELQSMEFSPAGQEEEKSLKW